MHDLQFLLYLAVRYQKLPEEVGRAAIQSAARASGPAGAASPRPLPGNALQCGRHLPPLRHRQQVQRYHQSEGRVAVLLAD